MDKKVRITKSFVPYNRRASEEGGLAVGPPHAKGGIPGIVKSTGAPIEFQGNEVIIKAESVAIPGNCEKLSEINQSGGGVPIPCHLKERMEKNKFEQGGLTPSLEIEKAAQSFTGYRYFEGLDPLSTDYQGHFKYGTGIYMSTNPDSFIDRGKNRVELTVQAKNPLVFESTGSEPNINFTRAWVAAGVSGPDAFADMVFDQLGHDVMVIKYNPEKGDDIVFKYKSLVKGFGEVKKFEDGGKIPSARFSNGSIKIDELAVNEDGSNLKEFTIIQLRKIVEVLSSIYSSDEISDRDRVDYMLLSTKAMRELTQRLKGKGKMYSKEELEGLLKKLDQKFSKIAKDSKTSKEFIQETKKVKNLSLEEQAVFSDIFGTDENGKQVSMEDASQNYMYYVKSQKQPWEMTKKEHDKAWLDSRNERYGTNNKKLGYGDQVIGDVLFEENKKYGIEKGLIKPEERKPFINLKEPGTKGVGRSYNLPKPNKNQAVLSDILAFEIALKYTADEKGKKELQEAITALKISQKYK